MVEQADLVLRSVLLGNAHKYTEPWRDLHSIATDRNGEGESRLNIDGRKPFDHDRRRYDIEIHSDVPMMNHVRMNVLMSLMMGAVYGTSYCWNRLCSVSSLILSWLLFD